MVQSRFRGKDVCVYCDQLFFVYVCLLVWLLFSKSVKEKNTILADEMNSLHHSLNFIRLLRVVITPSLPGVGHLTNLILPGEGIFESFFARHGTDVEMDLTADSADERD